MHFVQMDEYRGVLRIAGPFHNLLLIRFGNRNGAAPVCERLLSPGTCTHEPLNEEEIVACVLAGIAEANAMFGRSFVVTHIRYVGRDTKPETVYGYLAVKIIEHQQAGGVFAESSALFCTSCRTIQALAG